MAFNEYVSLYPICFSAVLALSYYVYVSPLIQKKHAIAAVHTSPVIHPHFIAYRSVVDCIYLFMLIHIIFFPLSALLFSPCRFFTLSLPGGTLCVADSCPCIESHFAARQCRYIVEVAILS